MQYPHLIVVWVMICNMRWLCQAKSVRLGVDLRYGKRLRVTYQLCLHHVFSFHLEAEGMHA